jgi:3-deoxy-manno-octulosonate cytidylyltransferase (CMP-KDO synthetase)
MINNSKVLIVIPARMGGYRYPDKPLRNINGKAMIEWVYNHAKESKYADDILISTPDDSIEKFCIEKNIRVDRTSPNHRRGTERVYETYLNLGKKHDIIVNFQGDEPLVRSEDLDRTIECINENKYLACVNLFKYMSYDESELDQNEVKVVTDLKSDALYFSRNPIPAKWLGDKRFECKVEICVMPMTSASIETFVNLSSSYYEEIESVDMMRFVENGYKVRMIETRNPIKSVDCEDDRLVAEKILVSLYGNL